jgi:hypothetical protein
MSSFDDREKGYENMFIHEQEMDFKIRAKRNKLLGEWVAAKMNLSEDEAENYAMQLVDCVIDGVVYQNVFLKVLHDLQEAGISISENEIETQMQHFMSVAQQDFA